MSTQIGGTRRSHAAMADQIKKLFAKSGGERGCGVDDGNGRSKPLAQFGISASSELNDYARAVQARDVREAVSGLLNAQGRYWNVTAVRSPKSLLFATSPAQLVAFLAGMQPLAEDPDDGAVLVADWKGPGTRSAVASFLFNDVSAADEAPGDFVVESTSILALLRAGGARPSQRSRLAVALQQRYRQHIWVAQLLYDRNLWMCDDSVDDIVHTAGDARPARAYAKDRSLLATRPDLAAGWILSHALAGRDESLVDAIAASARTKHPAVAELRQVLAPRKKSATRAIDHLVRANCKLSANDLARIRDAANAPGLQGAK